MPAPGFNRRRAACAVCACILLLASRGHGLVLGGAAAVQTSAPADDPGWSNVVPLGVASAVYLGGGWILGAAHVGTAAVTIGGTTYPVQPGSAVTLLASDGVSGTDLRMFRIQGDPGLPSLVLISSALAANTSVTMIGFGAQRGAAVSYDASWTLDGTPAVYTGYLWGGSVKGWGTNRISGTTTLTYSGNSVLAYTTSYTTGTGATTNEAQGAKGDSGGAVFARVGSQWRLAGIMVEIGSYSGQPSSTAIFGNTTYSVELAACRSQIEDLRALSAPADIWFYDHFRGAPATASGDPDGDGWTNLEEYAFGMDPLVADAAGGPLVEAVSTGSGPVLQATYTHNMYATDITVAVEVSGDMLTWASGGGATVVESQLDLGGGLEQLVVRDLGIAADGAPRFMRVRVTGM